MARGMWPQACNHVSSADGSDPMARHCACGTCGRARAPSCDAACVRSVSPVGRPSLLDIRSLTALRWLLGALLGAYCRSMLHDSSADAPGKERSCATDGMPSESLNISRSSHRDPDSECDQLCVHNNRISVESRGICLEWAPRHLRRAPVLPSSVAAFTHYKFRSHPLAGCHNGICSPSYTSESHAPASRQCRSSAGSALPNC